MKNATKPHSSKRPPDNKNKNHKNYPSIMPRTQKKQQTIDEILNVLNPTQKETLQNLRLLIKNTVPEASEIVKQGKIVYKLENKDIMQINRYQKHLDVEFAMGSSLSSELLKSRGIARQNKNTRHVLVGNYTRVEPELTRLIHEAATLGFEHNMTG